MNRLLHPSLRRCCSVPARGPTKTLVVKQFHLRDETTRLGRRADGADGKTAPAARCRQRVAERRERLGQYYTLIWNDPAGAGQGEVEVVFQYQQGATASLVKRMTKKFPVIRCGGNRGIRGDRRRLFQRRQGADMEGHRCCGASGSSPAANPISGGDPVNFQMDG